MGKVFFRIYAYFIHYIKRKDEHSLHSPFLFNFYCNTVKARDLYTVDFIEDYRDSLFKNDKLVQFDELGALTIQKHSKKIKTEAKSSLSPAAQSRFLGALVAYYKPGAILEFGTNFGVTTAFLGWFSKGSRVITMEGIPEIAQMASSFFKQSSLLNIEVIEGDFDSTVYEALNRLSTLDLVFFDGNHKYIPTMNYYNVCLQKINENTIFVFHDIYWSEEMSKAWNKIRQSPEVIISIDLFYFGIVFFRKTSLSNILS